MNLEPSNLDKILPLLDKAGKAVEDSLKGISEAGKYGFQEYMRYLVYEQVGWLVVLGVGVLAFLICLLIGKKGGWIGRDSSGVGYPKPIIFITVVLGIMVTLGFFQLPEILATIASPVGYTVGKVLQNLHWMQ